MTHADFWDVCYLAKFTGKTSATGDHEMGSVCLDLLRRKTENLKKSEQVFFV